MFDAMAILYWICIAAASYLTVTSHEMIGWSTLREWLHMQLQGCYNMH